MCVMPYMMVALPKPLAVVDVLLIPPYELLGTEASMLRVTATASICSRFDWPIRFCEGK